jgi:transcriptional regulator with XRE-family HTH domain
MDTNQERRQVKLDLKPLRKAAGLSQQQVAEVLGVSRQHYVGIENNQTDSLNKAHLEKLCGLFNCDVSALFGSQPPQDSEAISRLSAQLEQAEQAIAAMRQELG